MSRRRRFAQPMLLVRHWLPALIVLSGVVLAVTVGTDAAWEGGALLVSAGLSVWLLNILFRLGQRGDRDRLREQQAREEFDRTGRWPSDGEDRSGPPPDRRTS